MALRLFRSIFSKPTSTTGETDATDDSGSPMLFGGASGSDTSAEDVESQQAPLDTDGDGLADEHEAKLGTGIDNPDSDGDGLLDGFEVEVGLDPTRADTDGDGRGDGAEVKDGFDPLVAEPKPEVSQEPAPQDAFLQEPEPTFDSPTQISVTFDSSSPLSMMDTDDPDADDPTSSSLGDFDFHGTTHDFSITTDDDTGDPTHDEALDELDG